MRKHQQKASKAEQVRQAAAEILRNANRMMPTDELYAAVRSRLDIPLRQDLVIKTLAIDPEKRFRMKREVKHVMVFLSGWRPNGAKNISAAIRRIVHAVLGEAGGKMRQAELARTIKSQLPITLRVDFLRFVLENDRRIEIRRERVARHFIVWVVLKSMGKEVTRMPRGKRSKEQKAAKLSPEEFYLRYIETDQKLSGRKGTHPVFSGLNAAFRQRFPELGKEGPIKTAAKLEKAGKIHLTPGKTAPAIHLGPAPAGGEAELPPRAVEILKEMKLI